MKTHIILTVALLYLIWEFCRLYRNQRLRKWLRSRIHPIQPPKPRVMQPKSERDCPFCQTNQPGIPKPSPLFVVPWSQMKGKGGRKKHISSAGYFCPNPDCAYFGISDEQVHALVGDGKHGKTESIQDFFCQACHTKFSARRNTVLYRLKTSAQTIERVLWLLALGVEISAVEEVFGIGESTLRTWLCRSGEQDRKFHERWLVELELIHVQLDELWANVKHYGQEVWVWVAMDAQTKLIPVVQVGGRTQAVGYSVVHELKQRLKASCIPVFSTDGLKHYFYALTAHFGKWERAEGEKKPVWVLLKDFVYARVIKVHRSRRLVKVERQILCGEKAEFRTRLKGVGLSGQINTSYIERINLTLRGCISKLARRTWGLAQFTPELVEHIEWWRVYYHFVRYHESLKAPLAEPMVRKGKQTPQKYQRRTPAMAAGLTRRRWTVMEVISYPLL